MRRWASLNDRQLAVLQRIGVGDQSVTAREQGLAVTVYALRNRGLVVTPRVDGIWTAELTDAGRSYLEHGRRPEAPSTTTSVARRQVYRPTAATDRGRAITAAEVLQRLSANKGFVVTDPAPAERAAWRRAIDAVKRQGLVPAGCHLRHRGRDAGDLVVELVEGEHPDLVQRQQRPPRLTVPDDLERAHPVVAALKRKPDLLSVSAASLPRALRLLQALVDEAETRGHTARVHEAAGSGVWIMVGEHAFQLLMSEGWEVTTRLPTEYELAQTTTYDWQRVQPKRVESRSGRLTLELAKDWAYSGRRSRWGDGKRWRLDDKLGEVLAEIEARAELAEQRRLAAERAKRDRQARWQQAMVDARRRFVEHARSQELFEQIGGWEKARRIRAYCDAVEQELVEAPAEEPTDDAREWLTWARSYADRLDPICGVALPLAPPEQEPRPEDLRPYLGKWSPYGPEQGY